MKKVILSLMVFGVIGFATAQQQKNWNNNSNRTSQQWQNNQDRNFNTNELKRQLNLSEKQVKQLDKWRKNNEKKLSKNKNVDRERDFNLEMKKVLNRSQYAKWQKMRMQSNNRMTNRGVPQKNTGWNQNHGHN